MMHTRYWLKRGGCLYGPYSASQLKEMASTFQFSSEDLISEDRKRWVKAARVRGLIFPNRTAQNALYHRTFRKECWLRQTDVVSGPYSPPQMRDLLAKGMIAAEDEISRDGKHWKKVGTFKDLQSHFVSNRQEQPQTSSEPTVYFKKEIPLERCVSKRFFKSITQEAKLMVRILLIPRIQWTFSSEGMNAPIVLSDPLTKKSKEVHLVKDSIHLLLANKHEKFLLSNEAYETLREETQQQHRIIHAPGVCYKKVIELQHCVYIQHPKRVVRQEAELTIRVLGLPKTEWIFSNEEMEAPIVLLDPFSKNSKTLEGADFHKDYITVLSSGRAERFRLTNDAWELLIETFRKQQDCNDTSGPSIYSEKEFLVERCVSERLKKRVTEEAKLKIITLRPFKTYWRFSSEKMDNPISFWDHDKMMEQMQFSKGAITVGTAHGDEKFLLSEQASESLGQILQEHVDITQAELEDPCPECGEQSMISGACLNCGHVCWVWMGFKTVFYLLIILFCIGGFITTVSTQMEGRFFILSASVACFFKFSSLLSDEVLIPISRARRNRKSDEQ